MEKTHSTCFAFFFLIYFSTTICRYRYFNTHAFLYNQFFIVKRLKSCAFAYIHKLSQALQNTKKYIARGT